jgi:hypothetical protein
MAGPLGVDSLADVAGYHELRRSWVGLRGRSLSGTMDNGQGPFTRAIAGSEDARWMPSTYPNEVTA